MIDRIFLDSGAHSLHTQKGKSLPENYTETDAFWKYVDDYCHFIIQNKHLLEVYVSVDIVYNPELSWKVQKYMEDTYGLEPLPVFHTGEDFKWFKKYVDSYDYIGVAGLGRQVSRTKWIQDVGDPAFRLICPGPDYLPIRKIHGFAMTSPALLTMYPFYSVDSTSWVQFGKFGIVIIPNKKNGQYRYDVAPNIVVATTRPAKAGHSNHIENAVGFHQAYFDEYLALKGMIRGTSEFRTEDPKTYVRQPNEVWADREIGLLEIVIEKGVCNAHELRDYLNLQFYLDLEEKTPAWPRPWKGRTRAKPLF